MPSFFQKAAKAEIRETLQGWIHRRGGNLPPAAERRELGFICDVRTNKLPSGREVSPKVTIGARASKALIISSALFIEASLSRAPFVFCYAKSTSLPEGGKYIHNFAGTRRFSDGVCNGTAGVNPRPTIYQEFRRCKADFTDEGYSL